MKDALFSERVVTIGELPDEEAKVALASVDEKELAEFLHGDAPYKHSSHAYGFIPAGTAPTAGALEISHPGAVTADQSLKNTRLNISLNRLRVAKYPGGGTHTVLFEFTGENQVAGAKEAVKFASQFRVRSGGEAAIINVPVFIGLGVSANGMLFRCTTTNVSSSRDRKFLDFLESDTFKSGLKLASAAQPAVAPLSAMVVGVTKSVLKDRENQPVQDIQMGLDFGGSPGGARLALGDYVAVQMPAEVKATWDWSKWKFVIQNGQVVSKADGTALPYNYVMFGVNRYHP